MLTYGESKAPMVRRWLLGDPSIPVTRLRRADTWAMLDPAAVSELPEPSAR
jgi:hypothetical protein